MGDLQLWAEIATLAELHCIPESLATYNATGESASRSKDFQKTLRFDISGSEVRLYLCRKYNLPARIRAKYESTWCDGSLRLAFHSGNAELSDEVRRRKKRFTGKEWLLYYGGKNRAIYHLCRLAALFRPSSKKGDIPWL
jgi:hypothetical protein